MNTKVKEKSWFLFCIMFIISYVREFNCTYLRFVALGMLQAFAIIDIVKNKKNIKWDTKIIFIIIVIILCMAISNFNSNNIMESVIKIVSVIDLFIAVVLLYPIFLSDIKIRKILLITSYAFSIILTACTILYKNDYIYTYGTGRLGGETRLYAGFVHPNTLGMFAFFSFFCSVQVLLKFKENEKKIHVLTMIYNIIISSFLVLKSDCRAAMISIIILICINLFNKIIKKNKKVYLIIFVLIILLTMCLCVDKVSYDELNQLLSYRLTYVERAIEDLKINNSILFGKGAFRNENVSEVEGVLLDNGYMNSIYQYGIIMFLFLIIFLILLTKKILSEKNIKKRNLILEIFIIFLVYSFVDNILLNISSFFCIFVYTLILMLGVREKNEEYEKINGNSTNV